MENWGKNKLTIGKKNPITVSKIMSEMMLEHKWNDLNKHERYHKLQDWRDNLEDAMQESVTEMYEGKVPLSEFQATYKMMKEETGFLVEFATRKNYSIYLSHLASFNAWMDLVFVDPVSIQPTYKEYRGF